MPLAEMIANGTLLLGVLLPGYAVFYSWRARRRNRRELCGHCGGPQYAAGALEGPSVVQGMLVCAPCAARLRRRYVVALAAVGSLVAVSLTAATIAALSGPVLFGWFLPVALVGEYGVLFGGVLGWMRRRNLLKLQQMVDAGELPPGASPLLRDR